MSKNQCDGNDDDLHPPRLEVTISQVDRSLPLPRYATQGSVGFDLVCRVDTTIRPGEIGLVPGNVIVHTPPGYVLMVVPRSSTPRRLGLVSPHGAGLIDQDYCGPEDEILIQLLNIRSEPVSVARGERVAQGVFVRVAIAQWHEVERSEGSSRGGFGSTSSR